MKAQTYDANEKQNESKKKHKFLNGLDFYQFLMFCGAAIESLMPPLERNGKQKVSFEIDMRMARRRWILKTFHFVAIYQYENYCSEWIVASPYVWVRSGHGCFQVQKNTTYFVHGTKVDVSVDVTDAAWVLIKLFGCVDQQLIFKFSPTVSLSVTWIELKMVVPGGAFSKTSVSYGTCGRTMFVRPFLIRTLSFHCTAHTKWWQLPPHTIQPKREDKKKICITMWRNNEWM